MGHLLHSRRVSGTPKALSRILEEIITNRQALGRIAKRGQDVALREFTFDRMVQRFFDTLQMLCGERKGNRGDYPLPDNSIA